MHLPQKPLIPSLFIDYVPAELHEAKLWRIYYYVKNPYTKKLIRKGVRVRPMSSVVARRKLARQMIKNINVKLESGWNPFISDDTTGAFGSLIQQMEVFLYRKSLEHQKKQLRLDTLKSYKSFARNISRYLEEMGKENITIFDFNTQAIVELLDYFYFDKANSVRTRNNYLSFITTLFTYFKSKRFVGNNPTDEIPRLKTQKKEKQIISRPIRALIMEYLSIESPAYLTLCLVCYYCFIRRTEMTKIRVDDIVLKQGVIYIKAEYSKNKKTMAVTIPDNLMPYLISHLKKTNAQDYLFSADKFQAGPVPLSPKKITDEFSRLKKRLGLPPDIVWYHLKDTGITELLRMGVPSIKVRNQARHYSIQQTEAYTPKDILKAESEIRENENLF